MKPKIVVVGSANTDFVVLVEALPNKGETVLGGRFFTARGGKGANQAVAAARLGAEVTFVARLGQDAWGRAAAAAYQAEGIDISYLAWDQESPSGVALILVDRKGENTIAVAPGANSRLTPEDVFAAEPAIRQAAGLLLQLEVPLEAVEAAARLARRYQVPVMLNPAPAAQLPAQLFPLFDLLTPNESEAAALLGGTPSSPEETARQLCEVIGWRQLVITLGAQGALVVEDGALSRSPAFPVQPVDTTGCGDAFNGALAVALAQGKRLAAAVRYASAAGAIAATHPGAQPSLPMEAEVEAFLEQHINEGIPAG